MRFVPKATKVLNLLKRNFNCDSQSSKEMAYKGLVRSCLEYASCVWDPYQENLKQEIERVQKRAARFVTNNYTYEQGSMTSIMNSLKWSSLQKRRKENSLILFYKGLKGKAIIPIEDLQLR